MCHGVTRSDFRRTTHALWGFGLQGSTSRSRQTRWDLRSQQRRDDSILDQSGSMEGVKLVEFWIYSEGGVSRIYWWIGCGFIMDCERKGIHVASRFLVQGAGKVESGSVFTKMAMSRRGAGLFGGEGWVIRSLIVGLFHVRCFWECQWAVAYKSLGAVGLGRILSIVYV